MPKKKRKPYKLSEDVNEIALRAVQAAIGEAEKPVAPSEHTDTRSRALRPWSVARRAPAGEWSPPRRRPEPLQ
ncbi:MAG: hypothetical protein V3S01_04530 [Dehalococcoidia bacterium]